MALRRSFQPCLGFVLQGFVTKGDTGRFAASTPNAVIGFNVNRALLIFYGIYCTDSHGVAILAIMFTDNIKHLDFLSSWEL
jgi:hypothetical protein